LSTNLISKFVWERGEGDGCVIVLLTKVLEGGREFASPGGWAISNYFTLQTWPTGTSPSLEVLSEHTFVLGALESHLDCYTAIKRNQALLLRPRWNLARLTINRCSMEWACRG